MEKILLVKYAELNTKSKNQKTFIKQLERNVKQQLKEYGTFSTSANAARLVINGNFIDIDKAIKKLQQTPGIEKISPAYIIKNPSIENFNSFLDNHIKDILEKTFKIRAVRADKRFELTSMEIAAQVGSYICQNSDLKVKLKNPELEISIEVREKQTFIYFETFRSIGGLPVGSSAPVICLLSGGIDSPVAAYELFKRGCKVDLLHFASPPSTTQESLDKVKALAQSLTKFSPNISLTIVNFTEIQNEIFCGADERYRITLMRRLFFKIAEKIADKRNIHAIATGESVGQVASQTIESMLATSSTINKLFLRPLISANKNDIIKTAIKIDTYPLSISKGEDCCSLFVPKNPVTKPILADVEEQYDKLMVEEMIERAVDKAEIINLSHGDKNETTI